MSNHENRTAVKTNYVFIWGGLGVLLCLLSCQNPVLKDQIDLDLLQSHVNTVVKTRCAENSFSLHRDLVLSYASRLNGINHTIKDFSPLTKGIDTLAYICNYDEGGWMARDIYGDFEPGVVYEEILPPYLIEYLKMNWGYDGESDDVLVYSEPSSWHCGPVTYQYYPEIFYGFN